MQTKNDVPLGAWEAFNEGSETTEARYGVDYSKLGPGLLVVSKTTYKNGSSFIFPCFYANSADTYVQDGETKQFGEGLQAPKGGWKDGSAAIVAIARKYNMKFKAPALNKLLDEKEG